MMIEDLLLISHLVDAEALAQAKEIQHRDGVSLGRAIAVLGIAEEETVAKAVAAGLRLEYVQPAALHLSEEFLEKLSIEYCRRALIAPIVATSRGLSVVMANPLEY